MRCFSENTVSKVLTVMLLVVGIGFAEEGSPQPFRRLCQPIIEFLGSETDITWVRAGLRVNMARGRIKAQELDQTQAVAQLPKEIREKLHDVDEEGNLKDGVNTLRQLRNWAEREIKKRVFNLRRAPEGLRQFDLWVHDKNGSEGGFAIRQLLKPDVGYFGVGHGNAGGDIHVIYPFTVDEKPIVEVQIQVDKVIELYSKLPGVRNSRFIFYKTCSGGLSTKEGEADAVRLARATGVPVIAPMGVLVNRGDKIEGKKRHWATSVEDENSEKTLPQGKAFRIFMPDGSSKAVSFSRLKKLIIKDEFLSRVTYEK